MGMAIHPGAGGCTACTAEQGGMMTSMLVSIDRAKLAGATGKIVKAREFTQLVAAGEVLEEARRYAGELRAGAEAAIDAARKQGHEQGVQQARAELSTLIAETTANIESAFVGLEARIVNTVMGAVQQILRETD